MESHKDFRDFPTYPLILIFDKIGSTHNENLKGANMSKCDVIAICIKQI